MILGVSHLTVRTSNLEVTTAFYVRVLGLREVARPAAMRFPGAWIALPSQAGDTILHIYAGEAAAGPDGTIPTDNDRGAVDHLAFDARGFTEFRARFRRFGLSWRELHRKGRPVWQMFVHDPNGLKIELSFSKDDDPTLPVRVDEERLYSPSERFFHSEEFTGEVWRL